MSTHCWWQCEPVQPLWKTIWQPLKKVKHTPCYPTIPFLGMTNAYSHSYKDLYMNVHSSSICNSQNWKQYKYSSTGEWINKYGVSIHWNIIEQEKEGRNLCYMSQLCRGKRSETKRGMYCMIPFIQNSEKFKLI